ncbi:hypothetical protein OKW21_001601 [Catalinimonas alkaloidigena]|uniref:hypothetical protein n=1 Tax=Catalinimonas alkaloidigena TaxID=1075417 RepID=UPI00240507F1|nr:hypothetical protein [Catalinimonas alkaloidigena]MDF9796338.1 hypothetical protein [Catalinimonas alkaloidigena]
MNDWIKSDRLKFKIWSLEWLNYYGFSTFLIGIGIVTCFILIIDINGPKSEVLVILPISALMLGTGIYILQSKALKFKSISISEDKCIVRSRIKAILAEDEWEINYDNQKFLQATCKGFGAPDMITIRFKKSEICWNLIHDPWDKNSFAFLLPTGEKGKRLIEKIKASA